MRALIAVLSMLASAASLADETIELPPPAGLELSVGEALASRHSTRSFDATRPVTQEQLATLLWAAAGITRPDPDHPQGGKRTAPSAHGSNSIDVWVTSAAGTYLYQPAGHGLVKRSDADLREKLGGFSWAREAPLILVLVAHRDRYPERVSADDRRITSYADAAVAGENLYLAATALGLGTVMTMSSSREAKTLLELGPDQDAIFVFPVGHEKAAG